MQLAIKLTAATSFDGVSEIPRPYPKQGADGVLTIPVTSVGVIDPDLSSTPATGGAADQSILLQSFLVKLGAAASPGDGLDVIDADGVVAYRIKDFSDSTPTPNTFFGDRRWIIPVGYRLKILGPGPFAVLRLNLWTITEIAELGVAPAVGA